MTIPSPVTAAAAAPLRAGRIAFWLNRNAALPLLVFFAALALRLFDLGDRPFWLDEVFTMQRVSLAPAALVRDSFLNHHMPSFFLMLSALVPLGDPQFWLRLPSAAFGALSVVMVYLIAKHIAGRGAGVLAALILGLSPTALAFSQEARSYTMEMSLILVALFGIAVLAMDIPAASLSLRNKASLRLAWLTFALGSAAALDVLGDGLPWVITANLIGAVMAWKSPRPRALLRNLLIADAMIAVLSVPFYIMMAMTVENGFVHSFDWIPPLTGPRIWYNIASVYLMRVADSVTFKLIDVPTPAVLMWLIDAALITSAGLGAWRLRHRPGPLARDHPHHKAAADAGKDRKRRGAQPLVADIADRDHCHFNLEAIIVAALYPVERRAVCDPCRHRRQLCDADDPAARPRPGICRRHLAVTGQPVSLLRC
jgi:mannosyltransferase